MEVKKMLAEKLVNRVLDRLPATAITFNFSVGARSLSKTIYYVN
jgi:hypothetical protein